MQILRKPRKYHQSSSRVLDTVHNTTEDSAKMDDTGQKSGFRRICIFDHLWSEGKLIKSLRVFSYVKLNIKIFRKTLRNYMYCNYARATKE